MKQILLRSIFILKQYGEKICNLDRRIMVFIHDITAMMVAVQLSFWLYFGDKLNYFSPHFLDKQMMIFAFLCGGFFLWFQTYRGVWRYFSATQFFLLAGAIGIASIIFLPLLTKVSMQNLKIPKMIILLNWGIALGLVTVSRLFYRTFTERWIVPEDQHLSAKPTARLLLVGISRELENFLVYLKQNSTLNYEILGIITENPKYIGRYIQGVQVLGSLADLPDLIENFNAEGEHPHHLVITSKQMYGTKLRQLLWQVCDLKVGLYKLPALNQEPRPSQEICPLKIEDLFANPTHFAEESDLATWFKSQCIILIGAGNLVGRKLTQYFLHIGVKELILCESNHLVLSELHDELFEFEESQQPHFILTYLYDEKKYSHLFSQHKPSIIIYLDGIYEDDVTKENPLATLAENTLTPVMLAKLATKFNVQYFIPVIQEHFSYDTTIGAVSLKLAESYCQNLDKMNHATRFIPMKLAPVISNESEFTNKILQCLEKKNTIELSCPNQAYNLMTPLTAAFSILKMLYVSARNPHLRGITLSEAITDKMTLTDLTHVLATLNNISQAENDEINFLPSAQSQLLLDYQQKELLNFEDDTYQLMKHNIDHNILDELLQNVQKAIDDCDQTKALMLVNDTIQSVFLNHS